jgi:hypothetical protein
MRHPRLLLTALAVCVALVASACIYTGPSVFYSEGSWVACGASGIHDEPFEYTNGGAYTYVSVGNCDSNQPVASKLASTTSMHYQISPGNPVFFCDGPRTVQVLNSNGFYNITGNGDCRNFVGSGEYYPYTGFYSELSYHAAWFFGVEHGTYGGFPQQSPWLYVG